MAPPLNRVPTLSGSAGTEGALGSRGAAMGMLAGLDVGRGAAIGLSAERPMKRIGLLLLFMSFSAHTGCANKRIADESPRVLIAFDISQPPAAAWARTRDQAFGYLATAEDATVEAVVSKGTAFRSVAELARLIALDSAKPVPAKRGGGESGYKLLSQSDQPQ